MFLISKYSVVMLTCTLQRKTERNGTQNPRNASSLDTVFTVKGTGCMIPKEDNFMNHEMPYLLKMSLVFVCKKRKPMARI